MQGKFALLKDDMKTISGVQRFSIESNKLILQALGADPQEMDKLNITPSLKSSFSSIAIPTSEEKKPRSSVRYLKTILSQKEENSEQMSKLPSVDSDAN